MILSAYVYMVRRPVGEAYWCAKGIQAAWMVLLPTPFFGESDLVGTIALMLLRVPPYQSPLKGMTYHLISCV